MDVSKETEKKIAQLQLLEQNLQSLLMQKQQFQTQEMEIASALEELEKTTKSYKIVGNIMVVVPQEDLKRELTTKRETVTIRIKNIEKQETAVREKAKKLQTEVLGKMQEEGDAHATEHKH
ncbi:prefoldin subunit [Candidatus Woesearchaeota archaeon]|nr:prefoldin subunit [Candidatus Woesearchaeota archaeon]